jgi:hypothetical protein
MRQKGRAGACRWPSYTTRRGGLGGSLGDTRAQEPSGSAVAVCCGTRQLRSDVQQCEGMARSAIDGLQRGDVTAQPWLDARIVVWPESRRRWGLARAGEGIGGNDPDRWASGGDDCGACAVMGHPRARDLGRDAATLGRRGENGPGRFSHFKFFFQLNNPIGDN